MPNRRRPACGDIHNVPRKLFPALAKRLLPLDAEVCSMSNQGSQFQCDRCGQQFQSKNELQEHARLCTGAGKQQGQGQGQGPGQSGGQKTRQAGGGGQSQDV